MTNDPKTGHSYDGIEEYDNPLPGWWKWLFIASIAFAPVYWIFYHGGAEGRSVTALYDVAMAKNMRQRYEQIGELKPDADTIMKFTTEKMKSWRKAGEVAFKKNCISCHGRNAEGKIGPNLTDEFYKNVTNVEDIAKVISKGAAGNAMPAWGNRLHPNDIVLLSAYIASLRETNADGGKAPEGRVIPPWPEPPVMTDDEGENEEGENEDDGA